MLRFLFCDCLLLEMRGRDSDGGSLGYEFGWDCSLVLDVVRLMVGYSVRHEAKFGTYINWPHSL